MLRCEVVLMDILAALIILIMVICALGAAAIVVIGVLEIMKQFEVK